MFRAYWGLFACSLLFVAACGTSPSSGPPEPPASGPSAKDGTTSAGDDTAKLIVGKWRADNGSAHEFTADGRWSSPEVKTVNGEVVEQRVTWGTYRVTGPGRLEMKFRLESLANKPEVVVQAVVKELTADRLVYEHDSAGGADGSKTMNFKRIKDDTAPAVKKGPYDDLLRQHAYPGATKVGGDATAAASTGKYVTADDPKSVLKWYGDKLQVITNHMAVSKGDFQVNSGFGSNADTWGSGGRGQRRPKGAPDADHGVGKGATQEVAQVRAKGRGLPNHLPQRTGHANEVSSSFSASPA